MIDIQKEDIKSRFYEGVSISFVVSRLYSNIEIQIIYFAEYGCIFNDSCNSLEALQAELFRNIFTCWDTYYENSKHLTIFKSTDWSQQEVNDLGAFYGISDTTFLKYLRTIRTWSANGTNKITYETILCELSAGNWHSTKYNPTGINKQIKPKLVTAYPNPIKELINLDSEKYFHKIMIYNNLAKLKLSTESRSINIHNLTNGLYYFFIELKTGETEKNNSSNELLFYYSIN